MSTQRSASRGVTTLELQEMKRRGERITVLTAYDFLFARLVDGCGVDVVLVGDSLAQVVQGLDSTLPVTLDEMIYHARMVRRGVERALVVVDLPFLSYQVSPQDAIRSAGRVLKESGAAAVKLEGGSPETVETVGALTRAGIPVMAHLGYTPQSQHALGGVRVQGREEGAEEGYAAVGRSLEEAGAFSVVLELVPSRVAAAVTAAISIPTIGIGAGRECDGQVLVLHDMLGVTPGRRPKFSRDFLSGHDSIAAAVAEYVAAVKEGRFPAPEHVLA
jgi:3-methyl-2-oxobutanoate hydroxymethyltransferase